MTLFRHLVNRKLFTSRGRCMFVCIVFTSDKTYYTGDVPVWTCKGSCLKTCDTNLIWLYHNFFLTCISVDKIFYLLTAKSFVSKQPHEKFVPRLSIFFLLFSQQRHTRFDNIKREISLQGKITPYTAIYLI